jgi:hypothetical protein
MGSDEAFNSVVKQNGAAQLAAVCLTALSDYIKHKCSVFPAQ